MVLGQEREGIEGLGRKNTRRQREEGVGGRRKEGTIERRFGQVRKDLEKERSGAVWMGRGAEGKRGAGGEKRVGGKRGERGQELLQDCFLECGIGNKDGEFWKELENWDVMILSETWVEERGWRKVKERLPKGYSWEVQMAKRKKRQSKG